MSNVAIEKVDTKMEAAPSVFDELRVLADRVRQRAFEIFEHRKGAEGTAVSDWLAAERDLLNVPESELVEKDGRYEVQVSAPGFEAKDVQVTALPDALIVKAASSHMHDKSEGNVRFCEFGQKTLFRRFDLPEEIDLDQVKASLEKGILSVTALKLSGAAASGSRAVEVGKEAALTTTTAA
jgi:HSP20 family protein